MYVRQMNSFKKYKESFHNFKGIDSSWRQNKFTCLYSKLVTSNTDRTEENRQTVFGYFNTLLSKTDRTGRQKIFEDKEDLNMINLLDLIDIYRICHPSRQNSRIHIQVHLNSHQETNSVP